MRVVPTAQDSAQSTDQALYIFEFSNFSQGVAWLRLTIYSAIYTVFLLLQLLQSDFLSVSFWQPVNLLMGAAFFLQLILSVGINEDRFARPLFVFVLCADVLLIGSFMALWGVPHAIFLFFLLSLCSLMSLAMGLNAGLKFALWGSFAFHLAISLSPYFQPETLKTAWIVNNTSLLMVTVLSGLLGEQLKTVTVDIEQKREQIQALSDMNQLVVENMPMGLFLMNSQMQILKSNRGAAKIFNDLALEGRPLLEVSAQLGQEIQKEIPELGAGAAKKIEVTHYNFKKERVLLDVVISKLKSLQGAGAEFICLFQNVTEIRQLEHAMRQKEKLAAVGKLAAGIAHEIRNPLASISGSVQLLQSSLQTQTADEGKLFAIVIREIDRLNKLISEFLDFVRPDVRLEDPIQVNALLKEILEMTKHNKSLLQKVEHRTELRAQSIIMGHYDKLKQAFLNIIVNAYQAMGDTLRPELYVQTYDAEGKVVVTIQDNGFGMTSENLKRLFEPFHTTKTNGTGLGLAITHKILETHEAEVFVESQLGQGAKFTFVFPAQNNRNGNKQSVS